MQKAIKYCMLTMVLVILICGSVSADFIAKTKMTLAGIPMLGNIEMEQTYLIKGDNYATVMTMNNPMMAQMGQAGSVETRSIVRKGGEEIVIVNYADSSYAIFDGAAMDSLAGAIEKMGGMLDSLKEMLTINKVDVRMTGNKKDIQGLKAEELALDVDISMNLPIMGPEPVPMRMTMTGSQWGTKDFSEYPVFRKMAEVMQSMLLGGVGFSSLKPILDKLGIDQKVMDEAMKFAGLVPVEGSMLISITPSAEGGTDNPMMQGMSFNIQMNTVLLETSTKSIPESEFSVPKGFKENDSLTPSQGGFGFPLGM
jgi:hypothetical protein